MVHKLPILAVAARDRGAEWHAGLNRRHIGAVNLEHVGLKRTNQALRCKALDLQVDYQDILCGSLLALYVAQLVPVADSSGAYGDFGRVRGR